MKIAVRLSACSLALSILGCTLGPIWAPRFQGRVVDTRDGAPIAGAVLEATYRINLIGIETIHGAANTQVVSTDADGRFAIGGYPAFAFGLLGDAEARPDVTIFHPEYGTYFLRLGSGDGGALKRYRLTFALSPISVDLDAMRRLRTHSEGCSGFRSIEACSQVCLLAYGDEHCP